MRANKVGPLYTFCGQSSSLDHFQAIDNKQFNQIHIWIIRLNSIVVFSAESFIVTFSILKSQIHNEPIF